VSSDNREAVVDAADPVVCPSLFIITHEYEIKSIILVSIMTANYINLLSILQFLIIRPPQQPGKPIRKR
jgi:hypothetical protein